MSQSRRFTARTALLAASTAGFVALGSGLAGADTLEPNALESATEEVGPMAERLLVENVAPTVNSLVPAGAGPAAGDALDELQQTANDPDKPAPDLGAAVPEGEVTLATPVGDAPNPTSTLGDTLSEGQAMTGLDGDPHDTVGHDAGAAVEETAQGAGDRVEETGHGAGETLEGAATTVVPQAAHTVMDVRDRVVPQSDDLEQVTALPGEAADRIGAPSLPQSGELSDLTAENSLEIDQVLQDPLGQGSTVQQSASGPEVPNVWDLPGAFGVHVPDSLQEVVESNPVTDDNYVSLGEEDVLGMVGNTNWDWEGQETLPQSDPHWADLGARKPSNFAALRPSGNLGGSATVGQAADLGGTAESATDGLTPEGVETFSLNGPVSETSIDPADSELEPVLEAAEPVTGQVEETLPQTSELGLPQVAEGVDAGTVEDVTEGLGQGTDLVHEIDLSDPISISGGTEEQETPEGMVEHPTVTDLPGSDALPVVS
ncbi:hypothetical protein IDM40_03545 [Nocardiopsis sp. HNM0947]|uniref:Secreted protein n=1 Tax=Nocardiopsis coralli TaxID=2772213 RepID=A0ABR9P1R2_9ACTN|nr:hypothetical protein [Nocardiopsis coralli]MBE2997786.1 hypothetical protein [Nocardiopsis coralli]